MLLHLSTVRYSQRWLLQLSSWVSFGFAMETCRLRSQEAADRTKYGQLGKEKTLSSVRTILFGEALGQVLTRHLQESVNIGRMISFSASGMALP
jgi:hypothetical protein